MACSPPRAPPIQYNAPLGTRWAKETAAAGGVGAFDLPSDPKTIGPWVLGECVGKGASGRVKIAKHRATGQLAAVKILPLAPLVNSRASLAAQQAKSDKQRLGIDREITMMKLMNHPNIIRIYDVYEGAQELFLVLEYVQGGELFDFLVNRGRLPPAEALEYFKQIIYGLNYAHTFSIIHRDLKPENILIASLSPPLIKIADWGMAAFAPPSLQLETSCGSPHYASPEIVNGERYEGNATDIWSCGVILYALLTGRLPFDDKNVKMLLAKVKTGRYEMPASIDPLAADLLQRMLVVDVSRRITIPEILAHPWMLSSSSSSAGQGPFVEPPSLPPSPSTLARPLEHPSMIDADLFASLRIIWGRHADTCGEIIKRDLCSPVGQGVHAKAFYFLLGRYRAEATRARGHDASGSDDELDTSPFDLSWELDVSENTHLRPYGLKPQKSLPSNQRAATTVVVPPVSGLAPPIMSRVPTVVSSKDRPPSPVGPRARPWRPAQESTPNAAVQRARSGSATRPPPTLGGSRVPPRRGYTFSVGDDGSRHGRSSRPVPSEPNSAPLQILRRSSGRSRAHAVAKPLPPPPPEDQISAPIVVPDSLVGVEFDQFDLDLGLDFNLVKLTSSQEDAVVVVDDERLPLLAAPRTPQPELDVPAPTQAASSVELPFLAKQPISASPILQPGPEPQATVSPPPLSVAPTAAKRMTRAIPRLEQGDKENQSVSEDWSYVAADEFQPGLGLGMSRGDNTRKEIGTVVFLPEDTKSKKDRKSRHMTMPPLKSKRSTMSILTGPGAVGSTPNDLPRVTPPGVGEFKGWFSNLFSWKGNAGGHQTPGTGVIYSADGLEKTRRDVGLIFEKLGVVVEGSGFTFAEGSDRGEDDFATGMMLRCRVEDATLDGTSMKPVRFRVEFSATPMARTMANNKTMGAPLSPNLNHGNVPSATANALLAAPLDMPLKQRANVLANRNGAHPTGSQTAILLVHEKGSSSTFKCAWKKLKERYDDVSCAYPILSPSIGATPFMEQQQRFAL